MILAKLTGLLCGVRPVSCVRALTLSSRLSAVDKQTLSQLRKKTGYPFISCKNALDQFDNDIDKAEEWLNAEAQKQGWDKATKLEGRTMAQGMVGVMLDNNAGAMVEVQCETDFVARNTKFQDLVRNVTRVCLENGKRVGSRKVYYGQSELGQLLTPDEEPRTVADLVALEVGSLGENMQARRAVFFSAPEAHSLTAYVHKAGISVAADGPCDLGKYGALLSYRQTDVPDEVTETTEVLARKLCQHIVGMNPETIGSPDDKPVANADDETKLIYQEFLLDPDIKVQEFLEDNGLEVDSWVRFECGGDL